MTVEWLGRVPYRDAHARQLARREAVIAGAEGAIWGLEHPPVITVGRRPVTDLDPDRVHAAGFELVATERGGLATCHEPGQLVVYLIVDVRERGVRALVEAVEDVVIVWLNARDVRAGRRDGAPGVWVGRDKICAVGLHVSRGVTLHGLALNLHNDKRGFGLVTPCGITDGGVVALRELDAAAPSPERAFRSLGPALARALTLTGPLDICVGLAGT